MKSRDDLRALASQGITLKDLTKLEEIGLEWVSSTERRKGYFRRIPRTRADPSIKQAQHRLKFSEIAYETFMTKGVFQTQDNREIPANAQIIANKLKGTGQPKRIPSLQERLLRLLLEG